MPKILDKNGNPINTALLKAEIAAPSLTGVRSVLSGNPAQGLTPDRLAQLLRAAETGSAEGYLALAEQMEERYLHYGSVLNTRKRAVQGLEILVEAGGEDAASQAQAELARGLIPLVKAALYDMMDALGKGYSMLENIWDTSEKQWMPKGLVWRDPRWFIPSRLDGRTFRLRDGNVHPVPGPEGFADGLPLPPYKFVQHVAVSKSGLPLRGGIARAVAWAYLFQNYAIKDWVVFAEIYGQPIRIGKYEENTTSPEQIQVLLDALRSIGTDAAAALPKSMEVELIGAQSKANPDIYKSLAEYMNSQVSKFVLGQTLTTETSSSGGGAFALGKVHNEVRYDILHADCRDVTDTLNRDLVVPVIDLNFGPQKKYPTLIVRFNEPEDLTALADNLDKLIPNGVPVPLKWALDKFGIPEAQPGEAILIPLTTAKPVDQPGAPADAAAPSPSGRGLGRGQPQTATATAAHSQEAAAPDEIDALADLALAGWKPLMQPITHPIADALATALAAGETLAEFAERLPGLLEQMDPSQLAANLTQSAFIARLAGNAEIKETP